MREREKPHRRDKSFERTSEGEEFWERKSTGVKSANRKTVTFLKSQLKNPELAISKLVRSDEDLNAKQELLRSIPESEKSERFICCSPRRDFCGSGMRENMRATAE